MKDLIEIKNKDNKLETKELVATYTLNNLYNYLIYKDLNADNFYVARYEGEDVVDLITNLSEEEINLAKILIEGEVYGN